MRDIFLIYFSSSRFHRIFILLLAVHHISCVKVTCTYRDVTWGSHFDNKIYECNIQDKLVITDRSQTITNVSEEEEPEPETTALTTTMTTIVVATNKPEIEATTKMESFLDKLKNFEKSTKQQEIKENSKLRFPVWTKAAIGGAT
ncbi:unnamed protein product [Chironomus riparius]|uniref:Uncharacterized protein n=1 Tax=Chironomus riparius TaxID=315576 RepID=A0A9N9S9K4_9DIPT|nr:unnamed protein product [Chironomus riparius]